MEHANDNTLPRTRAEAKKMGSLHYFTGKPCKHNHVAIRTTSSGQCKECAREIQRAAYPMRADKLKAYQVEYRANNRQKSRDTSKKWREDNPQRFLDSIREWKMKNPDYRSNNIEHFRLKDREYSSKRRSTPRGKIDDAISSGIRSSIGLGVKRGTRWKSWSDTHSTI